MTLISTKLTIEQWRKKERADRMAHKIAFDSAVSILDSYGVSVRDKLGRLLWYEIDLSWHQDEPWIAEALRYLELSGLLRRHARILNRVNIRWAR